MHQHLQKVAENAPAVTYSATGSAVLFWGLHLSDIAVFVSMLTSICGLALQFYATVRRNRPKK